jgi:uncharacterized membrane protein
MQSYEILKSIHVFGAVLFLGNIIVTGFWKYFADRTGKPETIALAQNLVTRTDWVFTLTGVVLVAVGGYGMVHAGGLDIAATRWLRWGQIFFLSSGVIWVLILIPLQIKLARLARTFEQGGEIPALYWRLNWHWYLWGVIATVLPAINVFLMTLKP